LVGILPLAKGEKDNALKINHFPSLKKEGWLRRQAETGWLVKAPVFKHRLYLRFAAPEIEVLLFGIHDAHLFKNVGPE